MLHAQNNYVYLLQDCLGWMMQEEEDSRTTALLKQLNIDNSFYSSPYIKLPLKYTHKRNIHRTYFRLEFYLYVLFFFIYIMRDIMNCLTLFHCARICSSSRIFFTRTIAAPPPHQLHKHKLYSTYI